MKQRKTVRACSAIIRFSAYLRIYQTGIIITSLDSDSDSAKNSPPHGTLPLENSELVSKAVIDALKGGPTKSAFGGGPSGLFDLRRWGDLTPLERMTAGMMGTTASYMGDEDMVAVDQVSAMEEDVSMDVEE